MSLTLATATRNAAGNAIVALIDVGSDNPTGYIELRTGTKPTNPQTPATGTLLATLRLSNPAYGQFANGQAIVNPITPGTIVATGICGWFRLYSRDSIPLWDGTVAVINGGGDIEFSSINFIQGGTINLTELGALIPES